MNATKLTELCLSTYMYFLFGREFDTDIVRFGVVLYSRGVQEDKNIPFDFSSDTEVVVNAIREIAYAPSGPGK